ncbi:MAG TPA: hypothetical protein VET48_05430, partial [Steroidobacteraceae bacterium]|nr:hypothetical protein [Steroidobacteraceae bacterium]
MNRYLLAVIVIAIVGVGAMFGSVSASGASPKAKLPDWSGTWSMPDKTFMEMMRVGSVAPFKPEYAARARAKTNSTLCLPTGMPGIMTLPIGYEFLFTSGRVTILTEEGPMIRRIFTDGRGQSEDPEPTYAGESIGHWEGETLVID